MIRLFQFLPLPSHRAEKTVGTRGSRVESVPAKIRRRSIDPSDQLIRSITRAIRRSISDPSNHPAAIRSAPAPPPRRELRATTAITPPAWTTMIMAAKRPAGGSKSSRRQDQDAGIQSSAKVALLSSLILLRILVGFHRHSGENNYHGKSDGFGGDYEAQRHWMEITYHLPIGRWYSYDLAYWGLDYPPLTAYVSYICGWLSHVLVGPETVALVTSRAYEEVNHKAFMRASVLILDVLVYFTAVWVLAKRLEPRDVEQRMWTIGLALIQPSIILIDHGHFQYNTVALGLALWAFHYMTLPATLTNCIVGSILFCLSLNFKQMVLYYAPAVFSYLLGKCFAAQPKVSRASQCIGRFFVLGATVVATFTALWLPFVLFRSDGVSISQSVLQIVHRLFPFQRGLYEGKVSNIWCALSTKPFSFRARMPERFQPMCALITTLSLCLPFCVCGFHVGRKRLTNENEPQHLRSLLWAAAGTSLSFFLASFQVHEKSILLPLSPLSLLIADTPLLCFWFGVAAAWTLWPLVETDRIQSAYFSCLVIFSLVSLLYGRPFATLREYSRGSFALVGGDIASTIDRSKWIYVIVVASFVAMLGLHIFESAISPPQGLPDIFPVFWSIGGAGIFCMSWCCFYRQLSLVSASVDEGAQLKSK